MTAQSVLLQTGWIAQVASVNAISRVVAAGLYWLVLPFWSPVGAVDRQAHDFACDSCHLAQEVNPENAGRLLDGEPALCQACHQNAVAASHPIGIRAAAQPPAELPLNARGEITCSTCHRLHDPAAGKLRTALEGQGLCEACHQASFFSGMKDGGISLMAVGHLDASASLSGAIDNFSIQCMACHDKSAEPLPVRAAGISGATGTAARNHPVGRRYADSIGFGGYRPASGLPEGILLPDGRLSCVSCHVGYSERHGALVMDNRADRLCRSCHEL